MSTLMTAAQVASYAQVNVRTVYRKAKGGELPCYRLGTAIRFKKEEIDTAMKGGANGKGKTEPRFAERHTGLSKGAGV